MNTSWRLDWGTAACLLASAVAAALLLSGCAEAAIGKHEIGENDAQDTLGDTGITVPDVFKFGQMIEDRVGVSGKNTYYGRYDAGTDQFTATQALMSANPEFPAFRSIDCEEAEGTGGVGLADVGLSCVDTTQILLSMNSKFDPERYSPRPPDSETLLLLHDGTRTQLFVVLEGH